VKITCAHVIVTCPGRNFVTIKILTQQRVQAARLQGHSGASKRPPAPTNSPFDYLGSGELGL